MILKSFGCSFIFGSDLSDSYRRDKPYPVPSELTWPAMLAKQLDYQYVCYARPGSGNLQIAERALSELACDLDRNSIYVINWSYIDRFDYFDPDNSRWPNNPWSTILPVDVDNKTEAYYKYFHSEYRDKLTTLINIKLVIDSLNQKNYPFIMTYMDELMFDQQWHTTPAVVALQQFVRPYLTTFDGLDFLSWSKKQGFPISTTGNHPLEEAHTVASDYMIKIFHKQKTNDLAR